MNFSTACTTCLYIFIAFIAPLVIVDILAFEIGVFILMRLSICCNAKKIEQSPLIKICRLVERVNLRQSKSTNLKFVTKINNNHLQTFLYE